MTFNLDDLLKFFLPSVPICVVWLVGCVLALASWRRHPRVSQTALVACALLFLTALAGPVAQFWLFSRFTTTGWSNRQYGDLMGLLTLARVAFATVGYMLLLLAVFGWRRPARFPAGPGEAPGDRAALRPADVSGPRAGETGIQADGPRP